MHPCQAAAPAKAPALKGGQLAHEGGCVLTSAPAPVLGVKGVKPPMEFGEMTRDCFPGHAGKKALISR